MPTLCSGKFPIEFFQRRGIDGKYRCIVKTTSNLQTILVRSLTQVLSIESLHPVSHLSDTHFYLRADGTYIRLGPICSTPVAIPQGQDPNVRMTHHIERECGKRPEDISKVPRCASGRCTKVLYAPIKCDVSAFHRPCFLKLGMLMIFI